MKRGEDRADICEVGSSRRGIRPAASHVPNFGSVQCGMALSPIPVISLLELFKKHRNSPVCVCEGPQSRKSGAIFSVPCYIALTSKSLSFGAGHDSVSMCNITAWLLVVCCFFHYRHTTCQAGGLFLEDFCFIDDGSISGAVGASVSSRHH